MKQLVGNMLIFDRGNDQVEEQDNQLVDQATMQATMPVRQIVSNLAGEMTRDDLQDKLRIKNRDYFRKAYIIASLNSGLIEMTHPDSPNSSNQKYRLTDKGKALQKQLKK